jgi:hypothetical protein
MTIYDCLKEKLGREPTHQELVDKVKALIHEAYCEYCLDGKGRLTRKRK